MHLVVKIFYPNVETIAENRHGDYGRRNDASRARDGQKRRDKRETILTKPDISSDEDVSAGDGKLCKRKNEKEREKSKMSR